MMKISKRNRQILQMRKEGSSRREVAQKFKLSPSRIYLIERQDAADRSMAERRAKLREELRKADDPEKPWPVNDLADAIGLPGATRTSFLDHFAQSGMGQIGLRELMEMCLDAPVEGMDFMMAPLLRVRGIGKKGFWSVVNGLTNTDLGSRSNEEWSKRLIVVKQNSGITGTTPNSSACASTMSAKTDSCGCFRFDAISLRADFST